MNTEHMEAAFPDQYKDGMTLRDYFAAKAMQAMLASPNCPMDIRESALAASAYSTADAMMRARERM
jgi:hypothetical protein